MSTSPSLRALTQKAASTFLNRCALAKATRERLGICNERHIRIATGDALHLRQTITSTRGLAKGA